MWADFAMEFCLPQTAQVDRRQQIVYSLTTDADTVVSCRCHVRHHDADVDGTVAYCYAVQPGRVCRWTRSVSRAQEVRACVSRLTAVAQSKLNWNRTDRNKTEVKRCLKPRLFVSAKQWVSRLIRSPENQETRTSRSPGGDSSHVTAPYKLSFCYHYCYYSKTVREKLGISQNVGKRSQDMPRQLLLSVTKMGRAAIVAAWQGLSPHPFLLGGLDIRSVRSFTSK